MELNNKTYGQNDKDVFCEDIRSGRKACKDGYLFAMTTEEIIFCKSDSANYDEEKLFRLGLDIRIFNLEGERKWFRSGIGRDYRYRERMDDENVTADKLHYWDEYHFLDIDDAKQKKRIFLSKKVWFMPQAAEHIRCQLKSIRMRKSKSVIIWEKIRIRESCM